MVDCKENVRKLRIAWSVILLIGIATIAVSKPLYVSDSAFVNAVQIATVVLTIVSLYICYRFFSLKFVRNKIKDEKSLQKYMRCRFLILYFTFAIATFVYYVSLSQSIHLCVLFTVLLYLLIWPTEKSFNKQLTTK
jgi:DMSO reductase anchor subunit